MFNTDKKITIKGMVIGAIIAALYVVLSAIFAPISFGPVQVRIAESLTLLPILTPMAIPGVFIGCLVSNILFSGAILDVVLGSLASLVAAFLTYKFKSNKYIAAFFPVIINAVVVAFVLKITLGAPYFLTAFTILIGQGISCYLLGIPLVKLLEKRMK